MYMKKLTAVCAALCMCLTMAACGSDDTEGKTNSSEAAASTAAVSDESKAESDAAADPSAAETEVTTESDNPDDSSETENNGVTELILDENDIDISKPYIPEKMGSGRAGFIYPNLDIRTNLYEAPSRSSAVTAQLSMGEEITVYTLDFCSELCYIKAGSLEGWCDRYDLEYLDEDQELYDSICDITLPENIYEEPVGMFCLPETLDVKELPSDDSPTVYTFTKAYRMFVFGDNGSDWCFIAYFDKNYIENFGWVKRNSGDKYDNFYSYDDFEEKYTELYGEAPSNPDDIAVEKPVIYLYPEKETKVDVKLELKNAELWTTYPKYDNGWTVTASPDGKLTDKDGHTYDYLFWDSIDYNCYDMSEGFCVKGEDTVDFLRDKLTELGLSESEMNEFISYWLPLMEHNEYNLVAFQTDEYDRLFPLTITPQPDSMLRIMMTYKPVDEYTEIAPQKLSGFERKGFTVVEWGGEKLGDNFIR